MAGNELKNAIMLAISTVKNIVLNPFKAVASLGTIIFK